MIEIPEEVKNLYRENNIFKQTVKTARLRFYDGSIDLLYPGDDVWPADDLFPVDDTPLLLVDKDQISSESFVLEQAVCDTSELKFGECSAARLEIVVNDVNMDVTGKEFALSIEVGDYEMMLGIYKVESFVRQADVSKKKIVAYDRMLNFDVDVSAWYRGLTFPMTLKQYRNSLCEFIGIKQNEVILPLDDMEVTRSIDPSKLSGRDAIKAICEINGCFGQIDITGRFKYVFLGSSGLFPSEELYPADDLFPSQLEGETLSHYNPSGTTYEDFLTYGIDKVQIRQEEGDVGASYGRGTNAYTIQGNFLVFGKKAEDLLNIAITVHDQISGKVYRPCKIVTQALPWVEPGDGIICYTSDDVIETYCLKRTIKGIQAMMDTFEAAGTRERKESFGIPTQIIQLEGKTAIIKKSVGEVSVRLTDLKEETESKFIQTAEQILQEVTRATQAEASLKLTADQINLSVKNLKEYTEGQFRVTADQILAKVSKGDVSAEISVESGGVNIRGNRFSWTSDFSSMTSDGKLTCRNIVAINGVFSGALSSETFYANESAVGFGDFYVSADGTNLLRSNNGWVQLNTSERPVGSPGGRVASMFIGGDGYSGVTILGTGRVDCGDVKCGDILFQNSWTEGYTAIDMFKQIYNRLNQLRNFVGLGGWTN